MLTLVSHWPTGQWLTWLRVGFPGDGNKRFFFTFLFVLMMENVKELGTLSIPYYRPSGSSTLNQTVTWNGISHIDEIWKVTSFQTPSFPSLIPSVSPYTLNWRSHIPTGFGQLGILCGINILKSVKCTTRTGSKMFNSLN